MALARWLALWVLARACSSPARCSLPQPAVLSGCIAAEQGASLGAASASAPTTVVGTAKGITEALNMAQVLFGAVLIIFSVVWYLFNKHGQTPPSPRPEQGASFHEVYPASPNAEVRPTKQNKTKPSRQSACFREPRSLVPERAARAS